jgi:calcineurin-like phosphoesterase family protein
MSDIFFASDHHFDHARVIEYSGRPFADVNEMNETMIDNHNKVVKPSDRCYFLGDFSLGPEDRAIEFVKRLNGQKFLTFGNHDKRLRKNKEFLGHWIWARDLESISVGEQKIMLCHYPMLTWAHSHRGAWDLHGHSHGSLKEDPGAFRVDVGVDCWDYTPVSFEDLQKKMSTKTFVPIDHHGNRGE